MPLRRNGIVLVVIAALSTMANVYAEQPVFPMRGQSVAKQARDEAECRALAVEKSGVDPAAPPVHAAKAPALVIATEPAADDTGTEAATGVIEGQDADDAVVAEVLRATAARHAASRKAAQKEKLAMGQRDAANAEFQKAQAKCLESRGYRLGSAVK